MRAAVVLLVWLFSLIPITAAAQMTATLVADSLVVTADNRLVASGNVEAFYDGTRLSASGVIYDRATDTLTIEGPIFIALADGTILTATRAELDPRLENGLLRGARLVLDRQLQLAANRIDRVEGRLSQLSRVVATSCAICGNRSPLWDIRAERVVHDEEERQLYFDNAVFRIRGVPVFWVPRMRLPDPTLERATGLMTPQLRTSDTLGVGLALPLFIRLGDSRDVRLTPYVSAETRTMEARFRQAFLQGSIEIDAALSRDSLRPDEWRGYMNAEGAFNLGFGRSLGFDLMSVGDPGYLLDYEISEVDRIASTLRFSQVRSDSLLTTDLTAWQSLREGESADSLPPLIAGLLWQRRMPAAGGTVTLGAEGLAFARPADGRGDVARDVARAGISAEWLASTVLGPGIVAEGNAQIELQARHVRDDEAFERSLFTALPAAGVLLRWPLLRQGADGSSQILEPMVAVSWSGREGDFPPAEDNSLSEFDEGNLLSLTRMTGGDGAETGAVGAAGLGWTRISDGGDVVALTFGRVIRDRNTNGFSLSSGLSGTTSDWLLSGSVGLANGLAFQARALFDGEFRFGKSEARFDWRADRFGMSAAYVWLPADTDEDRTDPVSEWTVATDWTISDTWSVRADGRYDVANDSPARAGLGLTWTNECVTVDLSLARRYTETETADPSTSLGLSVTLNGFSAGTATAPQAVCRN